MDHSRNKRKLDNDSSNYGKRAKPSPSDAERRVPESTKTSAQGRLARIRAEQAAERLKASSSKEPVIKLQKNVVKLPSNDRENKTFDYGKKTSPGRNDAHSVTLSSVDDYKNRGAKINKISPSERLKAYKRDANKRHPKHTSEKSVKLSDLKPKSGGLLNSFDDSFKNSSNSFKERNSLNGSSKLYVSHSEAQSTPVSTKSASHRLKIPAKNGDHSNNSKGFFTPSSSFNNNISSAYDEKKDSHKSVNEGLKRSDDSFRPSLSDNVKKSDDSSRSSLVGDRLNAYKRSNDSSRSSLAESDGHSKYQSPLKRFNAHSTPNNSLNAESPPSVFGKRDDSKVTFGKYVAGERDDSSFATKLSPLGDSSQLQNSCAGVSNTGASTSGFGGRENDETSAEDVKKSSLFSFDFISSKLKSFSSKYFQGGSTPKTSRFSPYGVKGGSSERSFSGSTHFGNENNRVLQVANVQQNPANVSVFSGSLNSSNNGSFSTSNNLFSGGFNTFPGSFNASNNNVIPTNNPGPSEQNSSQSSGVIVDESSRNFTSFSPQTNAFTAASVKDSEDNDMDWTETEEDDEKNMRQMKNMISQQTSYHESEGWSHIDEACGGEENVLVVVDTNVFLHKLEVLANILKIRYQDGTYPIIYIPWMVIQELDYFKDGYSSNRNSKADHLLSKSRKAITFINQALVAKKPNFKCEPAKAATENSINISSPDDSILSSCLNLKKYINQVMLLSGDINLRNKAIINGLETLNPDQAVSTLSRVKKLKRKDEDLMEKASLRMSWLCSYIIFAEWEKTGDRIDAARFEKMPWSFPDCVRYMKENYDRVFKPFLQKQCKKIIDDIFNAVVLDEDLMDETKFVELILSLLIYMKTGMKKYEKNIALVMNDIKQLNPS